MKRLQWPGGGKKTKRSNSVNKGVPKRSGEGRGIDIDNWEARKEKISLKKGKK